MNEFITRFDSYPLGQRALGLIFLMAVVFGIYYMLIHQELESSIDTQKNARIELQRNKEKFDQLIKSKKQVQDRVAKLKLDLHVAREKLPLNAEIPSLLQRIHNQAKTAGLDINVFQREEDTEQQYYIEIPVMMELIGTYDELANFFYYIGRMTRIVNVRNIDLEQRGGKDSASGELVVTALATTFRYKADPVPAAGPPGRRPPQPKK